MRCACFRLFAQPHFHLREKNKFLEDRSLQIIDQRQFCECVRLIIHTDNFAPAFPVLICPPGCDGKLRLQQQDRQFLFQDRRRNDFTAPFAECGRAVEKEWNVAAASLLPPPRPAPCGICFRSLIETPPLALVVSKKIFAARTTRFSSPVGKDASSQMKSIQRFCFSMSILS